jgi:hypothetical protein
VPAPLRHTVAIAASILLGQSARGADLLRADLAVGAGQRDQSLAAAESLVARGGAVSDLNLSGVWIPEGHLGAVARLALERFTLARSDRAASVDLLGASAGAALALRLDRGILEGRLELGYGARHLPLPVVTLSPAGLVGLAAAALNTHGPTVSAVLSLASPGGGAGVEVAGDAFPVGMGARYQGISVTARRFGLRALVHLGRLQTGGLRWAGLLTGELARASARGEAVAFRGTQAGLGLGLRATWAPSPRPARLRVVVRAAGRPAGGVEIATGGELLHTDALGELLIEGKKAGPLELHLGGAGWQDSDEVVEFPARGEHRVELALTRAAAVVSAVSGVVRSEGGEPVPALVQILERDAQLTTDAAGGFRIELPPGRYTLTISAQGWIGQERRVEARPNEESIYNVELRRAP